MKHLDAIYVGQVFDLSDDDSTSSIDASSPLVDEVVLKFMAAYKLCADQLFYRSNGLLDGFTRSSIYPLVLNSPNVTTVQAPAPVRAFVLDKRIFSTQEADEVFVPNGLDLVPWRLVVHAIMLKVLAENLERREESTVTNVEPVVEPVAHVQEDGSNVTMGPGLQFGFESSRGQTMNFRPANTMSLPTLVGNPSTPLVDRCNRRSNRLSVRKNGYYQLDQDPSKRHRVTAVKIDETTKTKAPIPIATLQEWGIDCGMTPSELTEDAPMTAPTTVGSNDMQEE